MAIRKKATKKKATKKAATKKAVELEEKVAEPKAPGSYRVRPVEAKEVARQIRRREGR